jgi:N-acetylglucosaminyl-diphospho-decaprenol L-rhamnosyltransferase
VRPATADRPRATHRVAAVVVTYQPDLARLAACLERLAPQVDKVVVVDNGSDRAHDPTTVAGGADIVRMATNVGIAAGLNAGVGRLVESGAPDWILTLDQDSVLRSGAIAEVMDAYGALGSDDREGCGILAMRHRPLEAPRGLWRWAERDLDLGSAGPFRVRRLAITSGNLVRTAVAREIGFEEDLFVDQVDFAFSAALGRRGLRILEYPAALLDHRIGHALPSPGGATRRYEPGQRIYYVARNSTVLLRRGDLPIAVYLAQLGGWTRSYAVAHGLAALPRCLAIIGVGLTDALRGHLGRRERRLFAEPPSRRRTSPPDGPHPAIDPAATVTAIVVNYNSGAVLPACVASIRRNGIERVLVVDNASTDTSIAALAKADPSAEVLPTGANLGFGGGVNRGLAAVSDSLVLICNPDVVVGEHAVRGLTATLAADESLAIVGPRLVDAEGRTAQSARSFPSLRRSAVQAFAGLLRPDGRLSARYRRRNWDLAAEGGTVDWVTGACMLARTDALAAVSGFDEGYFLYVEEVDLCWRLSRAGWRVAYEPAATVMHIGGHSARARPYRMVVAHHRSLWRFARTTTTGPARLALPLVAGGIAARCVVALLLRARPGRDTAVTDGGSNTLSV